MSIKDLFGRKTVVVKNAESASVDAESNRFVLRKAEEDATFIPPIDFATASNFIRFGSAEEYYEAAVRRIYSEYPYDGSSAEKILYKLSSSYFDRHILEDKYPSSTGYATLNPSGYGAASKVNGYGLNASSDDYEYIFIGGGIRPAPQNQNDPSSDKQNIPLYKKFRYGTFYEEGTDKTSVFNFSAASGSTFEFWMKKEEFDVATTEREVILDLWNGEASTSPNYGRITLELDATNEGGAGANPLRFTYKNGTVGPFRQSLVSGSFTTSDIADGKWHHWAVSTMPRIDGSTNYLDLKVYKDGVVLNQQSIETTSSAETPQTIGNIKGRIDGYIGALIAPVWDGVSGTPTMGAKYAGKLSASLDEVRFWKKRINSHEIYNNWYHPIGGGANTDKHRDHLALYYKFNEGITLTSSIDSTVLDYSGRVANGAWTGYNVNSRNTGSCFVSASVLSKEPEDPIIRSNHQSVKDLISDLKVSGSQYDLNNSAYMYDMVPFWMREEDFEIGDNNLKKIYQIIASYFDTLYLQIESLPDIKTKQYFTMDKRPYPFSKQLLEHNGLIVPDLFISQGVLEKFSQRDDQNKKFEHDMDDLKKRIYYNIYNNLKTVYESKGTEKSYRNLLRCFGVDDEIVKLNLYTDYGIQYLTDKVKYSSQKTKFLNHNVTTNFTGRVYNTSSVGNPRTFISGSGPLLNREEYLAFTLETDVIIPTKLKVGDLNYFPTDFLTSSIMGFHQADPSDATNFAWHGGDDANLQVHLVRPINESEDAKFVITNNAKTIFAESETFKGIYDNERWALGLKIYPVGYPWVGHVANTATPEYVAELYGVTHNLNDVQREFTIKASMTHAEGSAILVNAKRFYAGCEATDFTGTAYHYSDLKIGACRLWYDKLDNAVLKQHNLDASNYGHNKIHGNATPYVEGLKDVHIPSAEALAFNWDFQQLTASDSNGRFVVEDFSSGTPDTRYGWIDDLILRENRGGGFGYGASSKKIVDNEFIFSAKKELPEISFTSDGVFIKGDEEVYFSEDEDTTDNVFAFEKSMYQVVSEEILKTFSTVTEYANLFMKPVDHYREEYKRLDHFKELYFERVDSDMDFERFTNYFKFIDASVSIFIQQLHPAMAKFNEGISDMVESHILERPKYKRQFPFIVTRDNIPDGKMAGVKERIYPWREGHAPNYRDTFDENDHCFWQKERAEHPKAPGAIIPNNARLGELRTVSVSEVYAKAKNLGTTPHYSVYTILFGNDTGSGGIPSAGEKFVFNFKEISLTVSFNSGGANETAFGTSTSNELKIDIATVNTAAAVADVIRTALANAQGPVHLAKIPELTPQWNTITFGDGSGGGGIPSNGDTLTLAFSSATLTVRFNNDAGINETFFGQSRDNELKIDLTTVSTAADIATAVRSALINYAGTGLGVNALGLHPIAELTANSSDRVLTLGSKTPQVTLSESATNITIAPKLDRTLILTAADHGDFGLSFDATGTKSTCQITYTGGMTYTGRLVLTHPDLGDFHIRFVSAPITGTETTFRKVGDEFDGDYHGNINHFTENDANKSAAAVQTLLNAIPDYTADVTGATVTLTAAAVGSRWTISLTETDTTDKQDIGAVTAGTDTVSNISVTNVSNTSRPTVYQGSTYAVRSFSRQYNFTYEEQKVIHGGTNYGHQKNRDFVLDHLKPHGGISKMGVPQEVVTLGVGRGLGVLGLDKCKRFTDPYDTENYSARHLEKAEYRTVGIVGRYADSTGDQPKSDDVDQLFKVKGHRAFPFNLVSGTIATGYNKKINDNYDDDFILTNLHSDTTTPSNDVPMQGPFAEAWVGGRQHRHVPMNRYNPNLKIPAGALIGPRRALHWQNLVSDNSYGQAQLDSNLNSSPFTISFWLKVPNHEFVDKTIFQLDPTDPASYDPDVDYGIAAFARGDKLYIIAKNSKDNGQQFRYDTIIPNDEWAHFTIHINPTVFINDGFDGLGVDPASSGFIQVYKNAAEVALKRREPVGSFDEEDPSELTVVSDLTTVRVGDLGSVQWDDDNEYELKGALQDFALWNKSLTEDDRTALYNGGKSIWPHFAPSGSAITNWWMLGDEEELRHIALEGSLTDGISIKSTMGQKTSMFFPNPDGIIRDVIVTEGHPGWLYNRPNRLDDQFSRPEAFRILVGDHPSEPIKDGALGMVGPDYGGPYPDTTRQMAVHYRDERAKRPFNIKNIQYGTASAILGNFKENYEVVHSVGRSTNNRKLVEFASVSSSLTSPYGAMLPATTNQATLFGSVPFLSGNVFGGTTNITADRARVRRYEQFPRFASGSFLFRDDRHWYGGLLASGSIHVSGSTLYSQATGSFVAFGSHQSGSHAEGSFDLAMPVYTVSTGNFVVTGSFLHGAAASGSITPATPPTLPKSTGQIILNDATTFGTKAQGSFKVGDLPTLTTSQGSFDIAPAFVAGTTAQQNNVFVVDGKTEYETQYTGSFKLDGPPVAASRGYANLMVKGISMSNGDDVTVNFGGVSKKIVALTASGSAGSYDGDIVMNLRSTSANTIKTIRSDSGGDSWMKDLSFSGVGASDFTVSFWFKPFDHNSDYHTHDSQIYLGDANSHIIKLGGRPLATPPGGDVIIRVENTLNQSSEKTFDTNWTDATGWVHVAVIFPISNMTTCDPKLYINGVEFTTTTGAAYSAPGGTARPVDELQIRLDDGGNSEGPAMHDFVIWDKALSSTEVLEAYASGYSYDVSTHSAQANIVSWWKLGREADFNSFNDGDELSGTINLASSHGTTANVLDFNLENEFRIQNHRWDNVAGNKSNTMIWDDLKADLNSEFTDWSTEYVDTGGGQAVFYIHKDTKGASGGTTSVSVGSGTTFTSIVNGSGVDAVASELKHRDNITIEGDQFDIFTTTEGSSAPHINVASSYRKALDFQDGGRLRSTAWDYNWPADTVSFSTWVKRPPNNADYKRLFSITDDDGDYFYINMRMNDIYFYQRPDIEQDTYYAVNALDAVNVGEWFHFTFALPKDGSLPSAWINGNTLTISSWDNDGEAFTNFNNISFGASPTSGLYPFASSMHDFAVWNTALTTEDANVLYNSGSWADIRSFNNAHLVNNYWLMGSDQTGSVGAELTHAQLVDSTIGSHPLTITAKNDSPFTTPTITQGIADVNKTAATVFGELKTLIVANTLYQEVNGVSTTTFSTSGNTATFTLTDTLPAASAPTAFSNNANQGFHTLSGPSANGFDISVPTGGSVDGHYVDIEGMKFYIDSDNSLAGGNYAESGGDYYVYSNATDDATWWARFAAAVNAGVPSHTTTHAGSGVFDMTADSVGAAGNLTIAKNGTSFTVNNQVGGGTDDNNDGNGRGISFTSASGSAANAARNVYVYKNLSAKVAASHATDDSGTHPDPPKCTFIQDGVWLHTNGDNRHYFVSSTGSSPGSSGVDAALWQRVTASLAHGINTQTGAPAVTSSPNSSFNIAPIAGGATITFTGTYTVTNGHDFTLSSVSLGDGLGGGSSGDTVFTISDNTVNGFGTPTVADYTTDNTFTVDSTTFEFVYPHNSFAKSDPSNVAINFTDYASKSDLLTQMQGILNSSVSSFNFTIGTGDGGATNRICMTGSMTGSALNGVITDNAYELVEYVTQTAGGTVETGIGHGDGLKFDPVGISPPAEGLILPVQTMASASSLNPNAQVIAPGIMWDNSHSFQKRYFISTTGETTEGVNVKTNGVNDDYWGRWRYALAHAVGSITGHSGSWTRSANSNTINFEGAYDNSDDHDLDFMFSTFPQKTGPVARGHIPPASSVTNAAGFGVPPADYITAGGRIMEIDGVTFENVYPYNGYASIGAATPADRLIQHVGSKASYLAALRTTMESKLTNFTNFVAGTDDITFNAKMTGSEDNGNIISFYGASTTHIVGGFAHEGVGSDARMMFSSTEYAKALYTSDDLRNHPDKGTWTGPPLFSTVAGVQQDGIWRNAAGSVFYLSTTGSSPGSNLTQEEWIRRVKNAFYLIVSSSGMSPLPNYTITINTGSAAPYIHQFNLVASLPVSNKEDLNILGIGSGNSDRGIFHSSDNVDGYGRFDDGGAGHTDIQRLVFANDDTGTETFRLAIPHGDYAYDPSTEVRIKATGSATDYFNRVSQSLDYYLTNYTILSIDTLSATTRRFTIRANNTGSVYNSDIAEVGHLVTQVVPMAGGHLQYNKYDDNFILLARSGSNPSKSSSEFGSRNYLFILDHDQAPDPATITNRTHNFTVAVDPTGTKKFRIRGNLVTGSHHIGKDQPDIVMVRGSTYNFIQSHSSNNDTGSYHPLVFHTSPLTSSGAGALAEVTSSWKTGVETPVVYANNGTPVNYATYATSLGDNIGDTVRFTPTDSTPDRLFYGCGNHANMGGAIYVVDADKVEWVSTVGSATDAWTALQTAISTNMPRLTVSYDDNQADDQPQNETSVHDDYLPLVKKALFKLTGSSLSSSIDDTRIITSGSSFSNVHNVIGAGTYKSGSMPGQALHICWGAHPEDSLRRYKSIGIGGIMNEDPFIGILPTAERSQDLYTSVYSASVDLPATGGVIPTTSQYYLTSSVLWNRVSASIMNTEQYTIVSMIDSHNRKYKIFNIAAKYHNSRYNMDNGFSALDNYAGVGFYTSSVAGYSAGHTAGQTRNTRLLGAWGGGFDINAPIAGGHDPLHTDGSYTGSINFDEWIQFETEEAGTVRIRGSASGWRGYSDDPANTIYWSLRVPENVAGALGRAGLRANLSGAWNSLRHADGLPHYQIASIPANDSAPYKNFYAITASITGSKYNFFTPASLNNGEHRFGSSSPPFSPYERNHFSASATQGDDGTTPSLIHQVNPETHGSHNVTGGVTFLPIDYFDSRININQREQALLEDGVRNKTIITSRFYGGGGPEVMTEAFLDVHAKEKSVYSALPYRNLTIKNNSGELATAVHEITPYGTVNLYFNTASISVTSHAGRREGLNTLHARSSGRFGIDSKHGKADNSDYGSPVVKRIPMPSATENHFGRPAQIGEAYSGGGSAKVTTLTNGYEAAFHKIHRNELTRPLDSRAIRVAKTEENDFGLITGDVQSTYPSNGYVSFSFWAKFDKDYEATGWKTIAEASDNNNKPVFWAWFRKYTTTLGGPIDFLNFRMYKAGISSFSLYRPENYEQYRVPQPTNMTNKWTHFTIAYNSNAIEQYPEIYIDGVKQTVTRSVYTGYDVQAIGQVNPIAGTLLLLGSRGITPYDHTDDEVTHPPYSDEFQGSMQDFAFYRGQLTELQVSEIYDARDLSETSVASSIIDYWKLGDVNVTTGDVIPNGTRIYPTIGKTTLTTPHRGLTGKIFAVQGRGKSPKRDNFYVQNILPQSDYNYSWVETSLGSNYSVRSGKQKVFGYWPKDGILVRNIKKGAKGTYYETQVTASTHDSAINFPTGSDIFGR